MNNISNILIYGMGLLFVMLAVITDAIVPILQMEYYKDYAGVIGVSAIFIYLIYLKDFSLNFNLSYYKLPIVVLFMLAVLSLFWTKSFDFSMNKLMLWSAGLLLFIVASNINLSKENIRKLFIWLFVAGFLIALIGVLQYLFAINFATDTTKVASTFNNKNYAMQVIVLLVPLGLYLLLTTQKHIAMYILAIMLSVILLYTFYSLTRGAWLAIGIELMLFIIFAIVYRATLQLNTHHFLGMGLIVVLVVVFAHPNHNGWTSAFDIVSDRVSSVVEYAENSENRRYILWSTATDLISQSPVLGTGIGSFYYNVLDGLQSEFDVFGTKRVHNDVLELGVELGLVGILVFVAFVISTIILWLKILKNNAFEVGFIATVIMIALSGSFVNMSFSFPYQNMVPTLIFVVYLAIFYGLGQAYYSTISLKFAKVITSMLLIVAILMLYITVNQVQARHYGNKTMFEYLAQDKNINTQKLLPIIYDKNAYKTQDIISSYLVQNNKQLEVAQDIIDYRLAKIPNNIFILKNKFELLLLQKDYANAEIIAQKMYFGQSNYNYYGLAALIELYNKLGKKELVQKYYDELKNIPEKYLKTHKFYYQNLFKYAYLAGDYASIYPLYRKFYDNFIKGGIEFRYFVDNIFLAQKHGDNNKESLNYNLLSYMPEEKLKENYSYYWFLLKTAFRFDIASDIMKYYNLYNKYFEFSEQVEYAMALYYFGKDDKKLAKSYLDIIVKNNPDTMIIADPRLMNLL